jgi:hypothetical protein
MEFHTRRMEVEDSESFGSKILIVSPPTGPGILLLARANQHGGTEFLCFSENLKRFAEAHYKNKTESVSIRVTPLFRMRCGGYCR